MPSPNESPVPLTSAAVGASIGASVGVETELVDAIAQLSFLVQNALAEIAGDYDLSLVQTRLLGILRDREPTMNALGRHLGLDKSSITGLVTRAQRRGLVERTVSEADRRVALVSVTETGRELIDAVSARFAERIAELVVGLGDADRQDLSRLASQIVLLDRRRSGVEPAVGPLRGGV